MSAREDHIAPWTSTYAATQIYRGPIEYCLAGSGHIAGVVNPPEPEKYGYWTNKENPADPEAWLAGADESPGSWWPQWRKWIKKYAGGEIDARAPGDGELKAIEAAPGSYAATRFGEKD
jgi:polyhydroxyalkanoate synthase